MAKLRKSPKPAPHGDTASTAPPDELHETEAVAEDQPGSAPRKRKAKAEAIERGAIGSWVTVNTRNPINGQLQNNGEVVKVVGDGRLVVNVPLNEGGTREVVCGTAPGQDLDPYWS